MSDKRLSWMMSCLCLLGAMPFAASAPADEKGYDSVEAKLRTIAPHATVIALSNTPISGLLQAQVNNEIIYVSSDGKYVLQGNLIDIDSRTNLTNKAMEVVRKDLLTDLDPSQEITFAPKDPKFNLLVFTDIDCAYCRKLHSQIDDYMKQGIAIHYLAFPRAGIGSHSYDKFVSVWCADDQKKALTDAKLGNEPKPLQCDNPVSEQYELGRKLGVSGTPALVTMDGTLIPGYMPPEQLKERLAQIQADDSAPPAP